MKSEKTATSFQRKILIAGIVCSVVVAGIAIIWGDEDTAKRVIAPLVAAIAATAVVGKSVDTIASGMGLLARRSSELTEEAETLQADLDKDFFTNLVRINFKYIDKYYLQTQQQANKSFLLSLAASVIGFIIIATGVILMFLKQVNASYVSTGAGVLSEFIAAVYFYLYNKTVISMASYHHKLVITQNISLGLKITNDLPISKRADAQQKLIEALTKDINHYLSSPSTQNENQTDRPRFRRKSRN